MSPSRTTSRAKPKPKPKSGEPRTALDHDIVTLSMDEIVPYWRNPRMISDDAVNAMIASFERYGYQQPIVVDTSNVIIIGHVRYTALRRMEVTSVPVLVASGLSAEKVKQLRVLDNRSGEYTSWNFDELMGELGDLDADLMRAYFPEIGSIEDPAIETPSEPAGEPDKWDVPQTEAEFICPSCYHTWTMEITMDAVRSGKLEVPQ